MGATAPPNTDDVRTVPTPPSQHPSGPLRWVEPDPERHCPGGWSEDDVADEQLEAEGRTVIRPDGGRVEVAGYVHRAEYMALLWYVQQLSLSVGVLVDNIRGFGESSWEQTDMRPPTQPFPDD